jgi:hypothetical protein
VTAIEVKKPRRRTEPWSVFAQLDLFAKEEVRGARRSFHVNGELKA